jgi:hypothetical protein
MFNMSGLRGGSNMGAGGLESPLHPQDLWIPLGAPLRFFFTVNAKLKVFRWLEVEETM